MRTCLARRLFQNAVLLLFISVLVYFILYLVPGGPFDNLRLGAVESSAATEAQIKRLEQLLGLDKPFHERYFHWLRNVVRGDWGMSWTVAFGQPVWKTVEARLGNTLLLMGSSALLSLVIALPI